MGSRETLTGSVGKATGSLLGCPASMPSASLHLLSLKFKEGEGRRGLGRGREAGMETGKEGRKREGGRWRERERQTKEHLPELGQEQEQALNPQEQMLWPCGSSQAHAGQGLGPASPPRGAVCPVPALFSAGSAVGSLFVAWGGGGSPGTEGRSEGLAGDTLRGKTAPLALILSWWL